MDEISRKIWDERNAAIRALDDAWEAEKKAWPNRRRGVFPKIIVSQSCRSISGLLIDEDGVHPLTAAPSLPPASGPQPPSRLTEGALS